MPRLNVVNPATASGKAKELFDGPLKTMQLNIFKGMANSPAALEGYLQLTGSLGKGVLSAKEREVVNLTVSQANGCGYCLASHNMIGKNSGLSEAQIAGARRGDIADDAKLNALARFTTAIHAKNGYVTDGDLQAFRAAGYSDAAVVDVIGVYASIIFTNMFNHVNTTDVDFPAAPAV